MTSVPAPTRFLGLGCRQCGYDLRGLHKPVCPECGKAYTPPVPWRPPRFLGFCGAIACTFMSLEIVGLCLDIPSIYASQPRGVCSNGLVDLDFRISIVIPVLLGLAAGAYALGRKARCPNPAARGTLLVAAGMWALTYLCFTHLL